MIVVTSKEGVRRPFRSIMGAKQPTTHPIQAEPLGSGPGLSAPRSRVVALAHRVHRFPRASARCQDAETGSGNVDGCSHGTILPAAWVPQLNHNGRGVKSLRIISAHAAWGIWFQVGGGPQLIVSCLSLHSEAVAITASIRQWNIGSRSSVS